MALTRQPAASVHVNADTGGRILQACRGDLSSMRLLMRTTIAVAVATAVAVYVFTPSIASASNDTGSPTVVIGLSESAGVQEEVQAGQTGDQGQVEAAQTGDQSEMQAEQSGDQGDTQVDQSGDQG
jgi:hypothetical protein